MIPMLWDKKNIENVPDDFGDWKRELKYDLPTGVSLRESRWCGGREGGGVTRRRWRGGSRVLFRSAVSFFTSS